jgi:hypothetical protein
MSNNVRIGGLMSEGQRTRRGGRLASVLLATMSLIALSSTTTRPAGAQEVKSPPETGTIRNGTAKATALVSKIGPGIGNLELAIRGGVAVTQVTNALAQATSQTADLGLLGGAMTGGSCRGGPAPITPSDLPQPTFVDNRKGDAQASHDQSNTDGSPFGFGRMQVNATKSPVTATAVTTSSAFDLAPAVSMGGGRGETHTRVLPGKGRDAEAIVTSAMNLGGVVTMDGMRWRAYHRTGTEPLAEASFDIGKATVGALPFPTSNMAAFESAANTALAQVGVQIAFPRVERFLEPADLVRVTPMRITMKDSPVGKTLLGPINDATRAQRSEIIAQVVAAACEAASLQLVGDIALSVIAGTGFLTVEIGGVEALSSDFGLVNPFGEAIAPPGDFDEVPPALDGPVDLPTSPASIVTQPLAPLATLASPPSTAAAAPAAALTAAPASAGKLIDICESIHPNKDACRDGAAVALGILAVVAATGVALAEVLWQRRARFGLGRRAA